MPSAVEIIRTSLADPRCSCLHEIEPLEALGDDRRAEHAPVGEAADALADGTLKRVP